MVSVTVRRDERRPAPPQFPSGNEKAKDQPHQEHKSA
jgi:hypothetical protein